VNRDLPPDFAAVLSRGAERLLPFGCRTFFFPVVASTNDVAARLAAEGAPDGTLVLADAQTEGRGRSGRRWHSPAGAGLYVSAVLRPEAGPAASQGPRRWPALITLAAGVAVAEGLRSATGLPLQIKWPNDVIVVDASAAAGAASTWRKVAGILAEGSAQGGAVDHIVLGIGINVRGVVRPAALVPRATSLEEETGRPPDRAAVLADVLAALARRYRGLVAGDTASLLRDWRELSPLAEGARVSFDGAGGRMDGVTAGIDEQGALLVRARDGRVTALRAGEVTWT
jgi:BirA family biotin operon repressor/biotin-[acetyl-CoA-carboxylase] ligase